MVITSGTGFIKIDGKSYPAGQYTVKAKDDSVVFANVNVLSDYVKIMVEGTTIDGDAPTDVDEIVTFFEANGFSNGGGTGEGVQSVTGDGVGGTPENPVLSYPTPEDIGAIATGSIDVEDFGITEATSYPYVVLRNSDGQWTLRNVRASVSESIAERYTDGRLRVGNPVENNDAVNLQTMLSAISSVYKYKGSVADEASLPSTGNTTGDVWNTEDTGMNYAWTGTEWDALATTVDLSTYYTKTETDAAIENSDKVSSKQEGGIGTLITNIIQVTQAQYDGLTPQAGTFYAIVG